MNKEVKATFQLELSELKKLLNKASDQVEHLQETLDEIANFKIQVSNYYVVEGIMMETYEEKLQSMLRDKEAEPIEWSQCNKELGDGYTETEVTFKYKSKTPVKK